MTDFVGSNCTQVTRSDVVLCDNENDDCGKEKDKVDSNNNNNNNNHNLAEEQIEEGHKTWKESARSSSDAVCDTDNCLDDHDNSRKRVRIEEQRILTSNMLNSFTSVDIESIPGRHVLVLDLPSKKNQDRGKHWRIEPQSRLEKEDEHREGGTESMTKSSHVAGVVRIGMGVSVYAVADGHGRRGGEVAARVMLSIHEWLSASSSDSSCSSGGQCEGDDNSNDKNSSGSSWGWWKEPDLAHSLEKIFSKAEKDCRALFGDFDGGSTLSLVVDRQGQDLWVAHVGDSDICLLDLPVLNATGVIAEGVANGAETDAQKGKAVSLSDDHSPLNISEFLRMTALCPEAKFEFDRQQKTAPPLRIYSPCTDTPGGWRHNPSPSRNVYYKNRANELATYVSEAGGHSSLANTRAIGDFRMKTAVGLSARPYISQHSPLTTSHRLVVASDGFWDSWPTVELLEFCGDRRCFSQVTADLERCHIATTKKYFGSSTDDTFVYFIQPVSVVPEEKQLGSR